MFKLRGPKRPRERSPGFTLGNPASRISPEGATRNDENRFRTCEPDRARISGPFRAKRLFRFTQGKPWAILCGPFGASPLGRMSDAKRILYLGSSGPPTTHFMNVL